MRRRRGGPVLGAGNRGRGPPAGQGPAQRGLGLDVLPNRAPDLARVVLPQVIGAVEKFLEPVAQLGFLADLVARRVRPCSRRRPAPYPVASQVVEALFARRALGIALAMLEEPVDALASLVDELAEMLLAWNVEVAHVEKRRRDRLCRGDRPSLRARRSARSARPRARRGRPRAVRDSVAHRLEERASGSRPRPAGPVRRASAPPGAASAQVWKLEREVQDARAFPVDEPEVEPGKPPGSRP